MNRPTPPAYGGTGWRPRDRSFSEEIGRIWMPCGLDTEWCTLRSVLLHRPGPELNAIAGKAAQSLMLGELHIDGVGAQHDAMANAYRDAGVDVIYVQPPTVPPPNQMFSADLFAMTREGAILGRPASAVRAGEERWVAAALASAGVPILHSVRGEGVFEGADLCWIRPDLTLLAVGFRTNEDGAEQVSEVLRKQGVATVRTRLPAGTMHLMGQLRIVDEDLAIGWPGRLPEDAQSLLESKGIRVVFLPDEQEARTGFALNFVTLGPRSILMPAGNPVSEAFYQELGISVRAIPMEAVGQAAGSIGCLTGILHRDVID